MLGAHDVQLPPPPVLGDRLLDGGDARHVDGRLVLQRGEDLLRLRLWQFPEGAGILIQLDQQGTNLRVEVLIGGNSRAANARVALANMRAVAATVERKVGMGNFLS
jgi:hypothetical protein